MDNRLSSLNGAQKINFTNNFSTEIFYKNGAKETINHIEPPQPDHNRMIHFKLSLSEGLCINLDEVRKFVVQVKSIATKSDVELIS